VSEEFLRVALQEIQTELDELERIVIHCNNDEHIFKNSKSIEGHLHKIKGLAPMIGQEMIGEIAKTADVVMKHLIDHGSLAGSYKFVVETIESMKNLFSGHKSSDTDDFKKRAQETFSQISTWQ
jgi:chemotaxis protein histidine kinase CheA